MPVPKPASDYATAKTLAAPDVPWPKADWWKYYNDSQLDGLIDEALKNAPDMKIASARLRQALAAAQVSGADLYPTISANGSVQGVRQSLNEGFPAAFQSFLPHGWHGKARATADFDYEIDLFGKNRANFAAATSEADAAQVDYAEARLTLSTAVAAAYANLVQLAADRRAAADALDLRSQSEKLVAARVSKGLENQGEQAQAEARVAQAQAQLDVVDGQIAVARNQIAALLGKGPDRGLAINIPDDVTLRPYGVPSTLSADLMGRRPDVVAARLRAEAAASRIDAAHADFYPNIDLTGFYGLDALDFSEFVKKGSIVGEIGPAIHLPIFDAGRIEGNYRGARAKYDEAVATYDKTLTGALHDVADALANQRELAKELAHARAAEAASQKAYDIAKLRYQGGLSRYIDVLSAEDTLVQQRRAVADLQARSFSQDVTLVRALGGGFVSNG